MSARVQAVAAMPDTTLMTVKEVADVLRCSHRTIYRRVRAREISFVLNGGRVLIPTSALADYLRVRTVQAA